jgi:surface antigen
MNTTQFPKGTPVSWQNPFEDRKFGRVVTSMPLPSGHIVVRENTRAAEIAQYNEHIMPARLTREME